MRADIHDGQGARNAPCNGPNTDARDQLSPDHYIRLAPHGRSIHKYMAKRGEPSGQSWGTFLHNHLPHIAAMDLFVVPTIGFVQLYVLVIVRLARRELDECDSAPDRRMDRAATYLPKHSPGMRPHAT